MRLNQYIRVARLVNSCLIGANTYRVHSTEEEFLGSFVDESSNTAYQPIGHSYMKVITPGDDRELWMVPFAMGEGEFIRFRDLIEEVRQHYLGKPHFCFPFDLVNEQQQKAYLIRPIHRQKTLPIRKYMPDSFAERWKIAGSLFRRLLELQKMGLTSNGISREQLRICPETNEVTLWLNQTLGKIEDSTLSGNFLRHEGFLSIPTYTEDSCKKLGFSINGTHRDIYSAAVVAFYLIMYTHPFIGTGFNSLVRDDYLINYQHFPIYIMMGNEKNYVGKQEFGRIVTEQWNRTVPALQDLFDRIFKGITDPEKYWNPDDPCWDLRKWLEAIRLDAEKNDNEASHTDFCFLNVQYHQV